MRAIVIREWGGPDRLELVTDLPAPPVAPDGVLVRVRAAGVNPVDHKMREGKLAGAFPHHFPLVLGWDAAGVVESVGPAVTRFAPGDEVLGYNRRHELELGTYAEFTTGPEDHWALKPAGLSFEEAAAIPLAGLTAQQCLDVAHLHEEETLAVTGGSGGVGHFAVQLGVARGARVFASASSHNHDFVRSLGAEPVEHGALPAGEADAVLDLRGDEATLDALRPGGRYVTVAQPLERDGVETHYVFVRPHGTMLTGVAAAVKPEVAEVYPLERAADAHERLEGGGVRGKLVLQVD